jgi:hypothetical protein
MQGPNPDFIWVLLQIEFEIHTSWQTRKSDHLKWSQ